MSQGIEVSQVLLGMEPFVLLRAVEDEDDGELAIRVSAGGGIASVGDIRDMLRLALESLPTDEPGTPV